MKQRLPALFIVFFGLASFLLLAVVPAIIASEPSTPHRVTRPLAITAAEPPSVYASVIPSWASQIVDNGQEISDGVAAIPPVCSDNPRIMPLGDSITKGVYGGSTETRPDSQITGFRQPLYVSLKDAGRNVNFVGTLKAGQQARPSFDADHEGHSGERAKHIADNVFNWLSNNPADVVLLHIGTNDVSGSSFSIPETVDHVARILDQIDQHNRRTIVILALIINRSCSDGNTACQQKAQLTTDFNTAVRSMAKARIATGDRIIIVDMEKSAGIIYKITPAGDMADSLHPHGSGYEKMAVVWSKALMPILPTNCTYLPFVQGGK